MDLGVHVHFVHIYGALSDNALLHVPPFDPVLRFLAERHVLKVRILARVLLLTPSESKSEVRRRLGIIDTGFPVF
jgi:hypothetical protein